MISPNLRSLRQWQALPRESLILYSQSTHLPASGSNIDLAQGLFNHFNDAPPPNNNSSHSIDNNNSLQLLQQQQAITLASSLPASSVANIGSNNVAPTSSFSHSNPLHVSPPVISTSPSIVETIRQEIAAALSGLLPQQQFSSPSSPQTPDNVFLSNRPSACTAASPLYQPGQQQLPAIPSAILEKIRRGEFVNFDSLLPNNSPGDSNNIFTMTLDQSSDSFSDGSPKILIKNSPNNKNKVTDLHSWLLAWSLFLQTVIIFHGHLFAQLVKYQNFIAQLASQYNFNAWYLYDQAFRVFIANNPQCSWDQCNDDIFNLHIRGAQGRTRCFSCGGRDHFASTCPNKRYSTSSNARGLGSSRPSSFGSRASSAFPLASRPSTAFVPSQTAPFLDPQLAASASQSTEFCRAFNFRVCNFPSCRRIHRCVQCNQPHPAAYCTNSRN